MEEQGTAAGEERGGGHGLVPGTSHRPISTSMDGGSNPLNIRRKGLSIAFTATLLSSLLATIAAPAVFGAVNVTSAGPITPGGTSTGTATFQFVENSSNCFAVAPLAAGNELTVRIADSANGNTVHFVGTPVPSGPQSLGNSDCHALHDERIERHAQRQLDGLRHQHRRGAHGHGVEQSRLTPARPSATSTRTWPAPRPPAFFPR